MRLRLARSRQTLSLLAALVLAPACLAGRDATGAETAPAGAAQAAPKQAAPSKPRVRKPRRRRTPPRNVRVQPPIIEDQRVLPPRILPPELKAPEAPKIPWLVRWMIHPRHDGMFIGLPIVDTNPNRGVTYGVMPVWVFHGPDDPRIRQIHAPSLTYNKDFFWIPTYRYYYYPTPLSTYQFRGSISRHQDRELMGLMTDTDFLGRGLAFNAKVQYDVDGSKRFYGIGPATPQENQSNFTRKIVHYYARVGVPFLQETGLRWNVAHHLAGEAISQGAIGTLPDITQKFPQDVPTRWQQDSEIQLFIDYDTRDNEVTTSSGSYMKVMIENSQRAFASEFTFQRYGIDLRHFFQLVPGSDHRSATRFMYEQLIGNAPFYLLPQLGGKYVFRGYGEGRYIDKGMMVAAYEERFKVYEIKVTGVGTEIEVDPFVELGTVFSAPKQLSRRYLRPDVGVAFRAVARPQVVGSVDVAVSQEGAAVFMDINYSF